MTIDRAIAIYREQRINELLRPYAQAVAQGYQQVVDELSADYEQATFDDARELEHRASMEAQVTRTPLGVTFTLTPGCNADALMLAANRMLYGDDFCQRGYTYHNPVGGRGRWSESNGSYGRAR